MIWVLLQSESPWQRNDTIKFYIYLCVSLYQEFFFFFFFNRSREFVPALIAPVMVTFFPIFTHGDVVNAQSWEVSPKKSSRATLTKGH